MTNKFRCLLESTAFALCAAMILLSPGLGEALATEAGISSNPGEFSEGWFWTATLRHLARPRALERLPATIHGVDLAELLRDLSSIDLRSKTGRVAAAPVFERLSLAQGSQAGRLSELQILEAAAAAAAEQRAAALNAAVPSKAREHWALLGESCRRMVIAREKTLGIVREGIEGWAEKNIAEEPVVAAGAERADAEAHKISPELRRRLETLSPDARDDVRVWIEVPLIHFPRNMPQHERGYLLDRVYRRHAKPVAAYLRSVGAKYRLVGRDLIAKVTREQALSMASMPNVKLVGAAEEDILFAWSRSGDGAAADRKIDAVLRWRLASLDPDWRLPTTILLDRQRSQKPLRDYLTDNKIRFAHDETLGVIQAALDAANIYHIAAMPAALGVYAGGELPKPRR